MCDSNTDSRKPSIDWDKYTLGEMQYCPTCNCHHLLSDFAAAGEFVICIHCWHPHKTTKKPDVKNRSERLQLPETTDKKLRVLYHRKASSANISARHVGNNDRVSSRDIEQVHIASNNRCRWYNSLIIGTWHIDHQVPLTKNGKNEVSNLCVSCPNCNRRKWAHLPHEFNEQLL